MKITVGKITFKQRISKISDFQYSKFNPSPFSQPSNPKFSWKLPED
jgi:hypothetical protein